MQLPRGRFHRLIKSTTTRVLIEEMASARFTGICTIVPGEKSAVLVLNEGLVVLAEYGGIRGQHALDAVSNDESEAAAELNLLTPEQVQLAREFNQPCAIDAGDAGIYQIKRLADLGIDALVLDAARRSAATGTVARIEG